jgi:predicted aspartyl protease
MKKILYLLLLVSSILTNETSGQIQGLHIAERGREEIEVPFDYINNFIIVDVVLNKILPLKFIFDTGAEYTIINKRELSEALGMVYEREFRVIGSDRSTELVAYLTRGNQIKMGGMEATKADLLVLKEDYFRFEEVAGLDIHGIIGANFFKHLIVQIDYQKKILSFRYPEKKISKQRIKGFQQIPVAIKRNRVYLHSQVQINPDTLIQLSLLLDTGASITALLHTHAHPGLSLPPHVIEGNLAMGLGGYLKGYLGRIHRLELGAFSFDNFLTNFQEATELQDSSLLNSRHGIVGNVLLSRFNLIIDYPGEKVYVRPIRKYNRGFKYDKSGLGIIATGENLTDYKISFVHKNSPADLAGLQTGDIITKINLFKGSLWDLSKLTRILQGKDGRKIRIVVEREGERKRFTFRLKKLI